MRHKNLQRSGLYMYSDVKRCIRRIKNIDGGGCCAKRTTLRMHVDTPGEGNSGWDIVRDLILSDASYDGDYDPVGVRVKTWESNRDSLSLPLDITRAFYLTTASTQFRGVAAIAPTEPRAKY